MMMKRYFLLPLIFLFSTLTLLSSCIKTGSQKIISKEINIQPFSELSIYGDLNVQLTQSEDSQLVIYAPESALNEVQINQNGDKIDIKRLQHTTRRSPEISIILSTNHLTYLELSASSDLKAIGTFKEDSIRVKLSGATEVKNLSILAQHNTISLEGSSDLDASFSGKIHLDVEGSSEAKINLLEATELIANTSGSSELSLKGTVDFLRVVSNGASEIDGEDFKTTKAIVELRGSSDADLHVTKELSYQISGSSNLVVYGNPQILSANNKNSTFQLR